MAAAAVAPSAIDLSIQGSFPIRLGSSILRPEEGARWASVRYNHKPRVRDQEARAEIERGQRDGESRLSLEDDQGAYAYSGKNEEGDAYVILCRGQGKDRDMVLERVDSRHAFNLMSTPSEKNASTLAERYPHLPDAAEDDLDLFGDPDNDSPPDESNPFDWRHFLRAELDKPETTNANLDGSRAATGTPLVRASANTPASKPVVKRAEAKSSATSKKRKPTAPASKAPNPKRVKAGHEEIPATPAGSDKTKPAQQVPTVRLDRKASIRQPSLDDSGELILEDETSVAEKPKGAMALALAGQLGHGPMSLQSVASSPASRIASPAVASPEEYTFEFDGSGDEGPESPESQRPEHLRKDDEGDHGDDRDADADADVEDLELPSPAQEHRPSVSAATVTGPAEDDDDLEGELELALMQGLDDGAQESEESEEE